jgi:hypothetical protein
MTKFLHCRTDRSGATGHLTATTEDYDVLADRIALEPIAARVKDCDGMKVHDPPEGRSERSTISYCQAGKVGRKSRLMKTRQWVVRAAGLTKRGGSSHHRVDGRTTAIT